MIIIWEVTFEIWKHYCIFIAFLVSTWGTCSLASVVLPLSNLKCDGIHPFCLSLGRGVQVGTDGNAHDQIYHATQKITYNISYEVFPNETFCWIYHSITFIFLMASYDLPVLDEMPCRLASRWQFGHVGISSHEISFGLAWRKWKNIPCCPFPGSNEKLSMLSFLETSNSEFWSIEFMALYLFADTLAVSPIPYHLLLETRLCCSEVGPCLSSKATNGQ